MDLKQLVNTEKVSHNGPLYTNSLHLFTKEKFQGILVVFKIPFCDVQLANHDLPRSAFQSKGVSSQEPHLYW